MKNRYFAFPVLMLGMALAANAQTAAPTKVGVIQIQSALATTKDGQKAAADLESRMGPRKRDLDKKQADIKELQDKLARGGNAMADNVKADLARQIDTQTKNYNRDMEDAQAELDQEQRKVLDQLGQKMMQVIDKYAVANGYSVILDVSNPNTPVLYASNGIDITKDIIDLYDKANAASSAAEPAKPAMPKPAAAAPAAPKPAATTPAAPKPATAAPATKK